MCNKDKTRGKLTEKIVEMSAIFLPHEECANPRVVLIEGDPGMGKTTYCNKVAFDWATGKAGGHFLKFKVVLFLKCCDIDSNLQDAIVTQILPLDIKERERENFFDFIKHNQSNILLLLDGLDELPRGKLSEFKEIIKGRNSIFYGCPLVVTARHEAGIEVMKDCDTLLEIEGFTTADANEFIHKFFQGEGEQGAKIAQKLLDKLNEDESLTELIANPLNTALLCLLGEHSEGKLPESKTNLYREIVEDVLRRYRGKNNFPETSEVLLEVYKPQLKHLGSIAWKALLENKKFFDKSQLGSHTDLPEFEFLSLQRGSNRRRPCHQYSFLHKSFQEWFTSYYLCCLLLSGEMSPEDLAADKRYFSELKQVLLFTCGILAEESQDKAMALIKSLAAHIKGDEGENWLAGSRNRNEKFVVAVECIKECKKEGNFHLDLARTFGKFLTLQSVFVFGRNLGSVECDVIAEILTENTSLTDLDLSGDKLGSEGTEKICEMLRHNKTLTRLGLSYNELGSEGADTIFKMLYHNKTLTVLYLFANELGSDCADKICKMLYHNKTLTRLYLSGNQLGSECADKICKMLCHNKTLTYLDLSGNELGSECADKICEALNKNKTLKGLDLSSNNISYPVRKKLKKAHGGRIDI